MWLQALLLVFVRAWLLGLQLGIAMWALKAAGEPSLLQAWLLV